MTGTYGYPRQRRSSYAHLVLAGTAFLLALWVAGDRLGWFRPAPDGKPRVVTPRGELADFEKAVVDIFERSAPSVVHITTEYRVGWGRSRQQAGSGSGFFWDESGTIVTNAHVVEGFSVVKVATADAAFEADVIGRAPQHDIAVLQLRTMPATFKPLPLGTSDDLRVGQSAVAIGNPFGLDQTLTTGVISQLDRTIETSAGARLTGVIQVDAAINPGNSGGPLLDSAGRLIGMNTAIYSKTGANVGIGFAVPVDTINVIVPWLISPQEARRDLGLVGEPRSLSRIPGSKFSSGLLVTDFVSDNSGAREAGIRAWDDETSSGDIITVVNGRRVNSVSHIIRALDKNVRGDKIDVIFLRIEDGRVKTMQTKVELR